MMTNGEYERTLAQIAILKELLPQYSHKTLDNIIQGLEARIKEAEDWCIKHEATLVGFPEFDVLTNIDDGKRKTTKSGYKCIFCGNDLKWSNCENESELSDNYADNDEARVWYFLCPCCGCDYEIFEPTEEEKADSYKEYWEL